METSHPRGSDAANPDSRHSRSKHDFWHTLAKMQAINSTSCPKIPDRALVNLRKAEGAMRFDKYSVIVWASVMLSALTANAKPPSSAEAIQRCKEEFVDEFIIQRGEDWFLGLKNPRSRDEAILQIRGVQPEIDGKSLTLADKLNGLDWEGYVNFDASTRRLYKLPGGPWGPWESSTFLVTGCQLKHENGKWTVRRLEWSGHWPLSFGSNLVLPHFFRPTAIPQ